jgi:DNA-binding IclR family transcriptional regulator
MTSEQSDDVRTIQSVDRACAIMEEIRQAGELTLTELADRIDLSMGSLQTHMHTLAANGFVTKEDRTYKLAPQFLTYGEHVRNNLRLYRVGREVVDTIAHETGKNAHLITDQDGREVTLYQSFGEASVGSDLYIWHQAKLEWQLHWSASGKAILANLPEQQVRDVVAEYGLKRRTPQTITDEETLFAELAEIREQGYALNDEEEMSGLRAVAAPVQAPDEELLGSISVSAPKTQLPDEKFYEEFPEYVMDKANVIRVRLQAEDFQANE